ncbi:hypothetical protein ACFST9_00190 [Hymenobacter monticola]|uniref:hypothetical protein n=1 Tax=Hymenobacter monticola TaxID=1705399 RepID=UPI00363E0E6F
MKNGNYLRGLIAITTCGLVSCFSNKYELEGEKKVVGAQDLIVRIYQEDKFDNVTAIEFELVNDKDSILIPANYLTGTDMAHETIDRYYAGLHDSIFYLCYPYPTIYAIEHLSPYKKQLPLDSLFKRLKEYDPRLIIAEH